MTENVTKHVRIETLQTDCTIDSKLTFEGGLVIPKDSNPLLFNGPCYAMERHETFYVLTTYRTNGMETVVEVERGLRREKIAGTNSAVLNEKEPNHILEEVRSIRAAGQHMENVNGLIKLCRKQHQGVIEISREPSTARVTEVYGATLEP